MEVDWAILIFFPFSTSLMAVSALLVGEMTEVPFSLLFSSIFNICQGKSIGNLINLVKYLGGRIWSYLYLCTFTNPTTIRAVGSENPSPDTYLRQQLRRILLHLVRRNRYSQSFVNGVVISLVLISPYQVRICSYRNYVLCHVPLSDVIDFSFNKESRAQMIYLKLHCQRIRYT